MKKLPVLVNFFNRPDKLISVLNKLKEIPDIEIFYASDGPKSDEDELRISECLENIEIITGKINYKNLLLRNQNLGCKLAVTGNLSWFFDIVDYGMVLEDDTVPNNNFFKNGRIALEEFNNSSKYISVNGSNLRQDANTKMVFRETFLPLFWGWGSWSNMWRLYQIDISDMNEVIKNTSNKLYGSKFSPQKYLFENIFRTRFNDVQRGYIDTWDYSFIASAWRNEKLSLQMNDNSVINIGFDRFATHTVGRKPTWVPTEYTKSSPRFGVAGIQFNSDKWIIKQAFNANVLELSKNSLKLMLRKIKIL